MKEYKENLPEDEERITEINKKIIKQEINLPEPDKDTFLKQHYKNIEKKSKEALAAISQINPLGLPLIKVKTSLEKDINNLRIDLLKLSSNQQKGIDKERDYINSLINEKENQIRVIDKFLETTDNLSLDSNKPRIDSDIFDEGVHWS